MENTQMDEKLYGKQSKLDKNHNGKLDSQDFKILRGQDHDMDEDIEEEIHFYDEDGDPLEDEEGVSSLDPHFHDKIKSKKHKDIFNDENMDEDWEDPTSSSVGTGVSSIYDEEEECH
jgi:hypothetical protein